MEKYKKAQVVILPTKGKSSFGMVYEINQLHLYTNDDDQNNICDDLAINQHLYFISDDKIKEGEWYINLQNPNKPYLNRSGSTNFDGLYTNCKKIIFTTDKSIINNPTHYEDGTKRVFETNEFLPQPPKGFVETYIQAYNKGNIISDVMIEYEYRHDRVNKGDFRTQIKNISPILTTELVQLEKEIHREASKCNCSSKCNKQCII